MVVKLTSVDNLRFEVYKILREQGLLDISKIKFIIEDDELNLKDELSKVEQILTESTPLEL